jgi:hypothetical protein
VSVRFPRKVSHGFHFITAERPVECYRLDLLIPVTMHNTNKCGVTYPTTISFSFIHQWLYSPLLSPGLFFSCVIFFAQTVGFLGREISLSQGRCLHTGQHKQNKRTHTDIYASSGIRAYDPSVRASEDGSCFRPRGHRDRHPTVITEAKCQGLSPPNRPTTILNQLHPLLTICLTKIHLNISFHLPGLSSERLPRDFFTKILHAFPVSPLLWLDSVSFSNTVLLIRVVN